MRESFDCDLQNEVHRAITSVGGYWPPEAAALRLLEELAELREAQRQGDIGATSLELADVVVIAVCIANQFLAVLQEPTTRATSSLNSWAPPEGFDEILEVSARIGRIINHYSGPKSPKRSDELRETVSSLVQQLLDVTYLTASREHVHLGEVVRSRLLETSLRDKKRFIQSFDPSTSPVLADFFTSVRDSSHCLFAPKARLWGAPPWRTARLSRNRR